MKLSIFIILLAMLVAGSVVAEGNGTLASRSFTAAQAGSNLNQGNLQLAERGIDDRIIDRLGLFDSSDSHQPIRHSVSLDVEKEDSDWSFEVTVTMEF